MFRSMLALGVVTLLFFSAGCRICCSPYDYCIPAFIDRPEDFRGCGLMYRAGSVFNADRISACSGNCGGECGNVTYLGDSPEFLQNAGNFGNTSPVSAVRPAVQRSDDRLPVRPYETSPNTQSPAVVVKPLTSPGGTLLPGPDPKATLPSTQELIEQPRRTTMPESFSEPISPPIRPQSEIPSFEELPIETIPFSPNDTTPPPVAPPFEEDVPISLEELRRLDPSVSDVQIISIEDSAAAVEKPAH